MQVPWFKSYTPLEPWMRIHTHCRPREHDTVVTTLCIIYSPPIFSRCFVVPFLDYLREHVGEIYQRIVNPSSREPTKLYLDIIARRSSRYPFPSFRSGEDARKRSGGSFVFSPWQCTRKKFAFSPDCSPFFFALSPPELRRKKGLPIG